VLGEFLQVPTNEVDRTVDRLAARDPLQVLLDAMHEVVEVRADTVDQ
jgi:hypothetical protein